MRNAFTLFATITFVGLATAQITHPCPEHPEIRDNYSLTNKAHSYTVEDLICKVKPGSFMTPQRVFHIMLERAKYIAPFPEDGPVVNCGSVLLSHKWHIVTVIDEFNKSVTNYTMPDHILFEGKVIRKIVQRGDDIYLLSIGSGNNEEAEIRYVNNNHTTMEAVWHTVDEHLKKEVERQMEPLIGTWRWIDWRRASAEMISKLKTYKEADGMTTYDNIVKNLGQGCEVQIAELDLDGDGKPGVAVRAIGKNCCNFKNECPIDVYEADGYKRISLIDDELSLVKPGNHGIITSTGNFFEFQDYTAWMKPK